MENEDLIKKFEELLVNDRRSFFDSDEFDILIDYYLTVNQFSKAMKAVDFALDQYPFSVDFLKWYFLSAIHNIFFLVLKKVF